MIFTALYPLHTVEYSVLHDLQCFYKIAEVKQNDVFQSIPAMETYMKAALIINYAHLIPNKTVLSHLTATSTNRQNLWPEP